MSIFGYNNYFASHETFGSEEIQAVNCLLDTTNFSHILSAADVDVQKCLDKLDDHSHTASDITTNTTTWTGDILTSSETNTQLALSKLNTYLETNTSFVNVLAPSAYSNVRIGYFNNIDALTEGGLVIGSGPVAGTGPSILATGYGSICIGNGYNNVGEHGPLSSGPYCICIGMGAKGIGNDGICIGSGAAASTNCVALGIGALSAITLGQGCVAIGAHALSSNDGSYNIGIGESALSALTSGTYNVGIGYQVSCDATYSSGVVIGRSAVIAANNSISVGYGAQSNGTECISIGMSCISGSALKNNSIVIGSSSKGIGAYNIVLGASNQVNSTGSSHNICIGHEVMGSGLANVTDGNNIGIGYQALYSLGAGFNNTCIGLQAGKAITTGNKNVFIGANAGDTATTSGSVICIGNDTDVASTSTSYAINIGSNNSGCDTASVIIGRTISCVTTYSVCIGVESVNEHIAAVCIGDKTKCSGAYTGGVSLGFNAETTNSYAVAIGSKSTVALRTLAGQESVAIGSGAQSNVLLGVAVGTDAKTSANYGVALGYLTEVTGTDGVAIGRGATSGANQFTIGPQLTDCRYYDASGWTNLSDEREKQNIKLHSGNCLDFIKALEVKEFEMKNNPKKKHIGLIAQDVLKLLNEDEKANMKIVQYEEKENRYYLAVQPIFMKNIVATQELYERLSQLEKKMEKLYPII